ncbi:MAG TPA: hypothetical protein VEG32_03445 [Clostridia bacterium]|nr:hypothetical protein [Clostridia bacterium]
MAEPLKKNDLDDRTLYPEPSPTGSDAERQPPHLPGIPASDLANEYAPAGHTTWNAGSGRGEEDVDTFDYTRRSRSDFDLNDRNDRYAGEREYGQVGGGTSFRDKARGRLEVVAGRAKRQMNQAADRASGMARSARHKIFEWKQTAHRQMPVWRQQARSGVRNAQRRTREVTNRHPLETIAVAAVAGVVIGFAMRMWRSDRG